MTHENKGGYAAKHPPGTQVETRVQEAVAGKCRQGRIACAAAHVIAQRLNVSPAAVGVAVDLQDARLEKCQLGLFGYPGGQKRVTPSQHVSQEVASAIRTASKNGRLPCVEAWRLADTIGVSRLAMGNACEALSIKIKPCQLGAF